MTMDYSRVTMGARRKGNNTVRENHITCQILNI